MDFSEFKKNRSKATEAVKKLKDKKPSFTDDRFWILKKDQMGNGEAIVRFLSGISPEDEPITEKFTHGFKEGQKWFIEDCPVTVGRECASCTYAQPYWDEGTEKSKQIAGKFWRKKQFIARILVIKDVAAPENNGKVFLFKFGKKVYDKIMAKVSPDGELDEPILVWDLWEGLDFKLKVRKVDGHPNYDLCEFYSNKKPIADTEEGIEKIYKEICRFDLKEFIDPAKYKTEEEFTKKFNAFMGIKKNTSSAPKQEKEPPKEEPQKNETPEPQKEKEKEKEPEPQKESSTDEEFNFDDDGDFNFDD